MQQRSSNKNLFTRVYQYVLFPSPAGALILRPCSFQTIHRIICSTLLKLCFLKKKKKSSTALLPWTTCYKQFVQFTIYNIYFIPIFK